MTQTLTQAEEAIMDVAATVYADGGAGHVAPYRVLRIGGDRVADRWLPIDPSAGTTLWVTTTGGGTVAWTASYYPTVA